MKVTEGLPIAVWDMEDMEYQNGARIISRRQGRYKGWRAPRVRDRDPFGNGRQLPNTLGLAYRFPAQEDTDHYCGEEETAIECESSGDEMVAGD